MFLDKFGNKIELLQNLISDSLHLWWTTTTQMIKENKNSETAIKYRRHGSLKRTDLAYEPFRRTVWVWLIGRRRRRDDVNDDYTLPIYNMLSYIRLSVGELQARAAEMTSAIHCQITTTTAISMCSEWVLKSTDWFILRLIEGVEDINKIRKNLC